MTLLLYGSSQLHPLRLPSLDRRKYQCYQVDDQLSSIVHPFRSELFRALNLSSLRRINGGGEAVVGKIAQAFTKTLKKDPNLFLWASG